MDPSADELEGFRTLRNVAAWAGISALDEETSAFRVLLAALGYTLADHPRTLAILNESDFDAIVSEQWSIPTTDDPEVKRKPLPAGGQSAVGGASGTNQGWGLPYICSGR